MTNDQAMTNPCPILFEAAGGASDQGVAPPDKQAEQPRILPQFANDLHLLLAGDGSSRDHKIFGNVSKRGTIRGVFRGFGPEIIVV
jgi:hypothetical protein